MTTTTARPRHLISLEEYDRRTIEDLLDLAVRIKADPDAYRHRLAGRTLLMIFEKSSLRTRLSFEVGMTQLGGHAIFYSATDSPLGKKESIEDTARVAGRYVDIIMARLFSQQRLEQLAAHAGVPVINALTDFGHPVQVLSDLLTVREKKGRLAGLRLAYLGDACNNVTHSLLYGCPKVGISIRIGCPAVEAFEPLSAVVESARAAAAVTGAEVIVTHDAGEAAGGADIVYTDSWMSYHIAPEEEAERVRVLTPYRVTRALMARAAAGAIFMNCLPAMRGYEQTAEVIDGPQSVVFDQAANRLHLQKALMLYLLAEDRG